MPNRGLAYHCHHDILYEYVYDFQKQVENIKLAKPAEEVALRLRLFRLIPEAKLPADLLRAETARDEAETACDEAETAYHEAVTAYDEAVTAYHEAKTAYHEAVTAYTKAKTAYTKAWAAYTKAWAAYHDAVAAYTKAWAAYDPQIRQLHAELCPDCPWDGRTIFPGGGEK